MHKVDKKLFSYSGFEKKDLENFPFILIILYLKALQSEQQASKYLGKQMIFGNWFVMSARSRG